MENKAYRVKNKWLESGERGQRSGKQGSEWNTKGFREWKTRDSKGKTSAGDRKTRGRGRSVS